MFTWHNPKVLSWKEGTYGMPPEEIHLWIKTSFKQWYLKFDETISKYGFKENERTIAFMQSSRMENSFF
jgi:hypothetical protein